MARCGCFKNVGGHRLTRQPYASGWLPNWLYVVIRGKACHQAHSLTESFAIVLFSVVLLAPMCVIPSMTSGHALDEPLVVRVGVYENPPKVFTDDNGDVRGLFPDVIEYIATEEGWELEYVEGNWTQCLERLENNEIDVMVDVALSDERLEIYNLTNESMLISWGIVYAQPDSDIESIPELDGKRMAVMKESIHTVGEGGILSIIEEFQLNVTIVELEDYTDVFEYIDNREVDVGVVNRIFGGVYEDDYDVVRTPIVFNPTDLRFAFPKNSTLGPYLSERIDYHLVQLKRDPDSIYYQSLREYIPNLFEGKSEIPGWLMPVLLGSFGVLAVIVSMNFLLRRQVKVRTAELRGAYEELVKEKNRSDLYLDLMSHDIANIDQGIYTYAELADRESVDNPELHMYTDGILRLIQRALSLIGAVRLLSKLNKEQRHFRPICLNSVLNDCIGEISKTFPEEDINVRFDPPDEEVLISAEPLIENLFLNILNNAVRHQRRKEKRVEIDMVRKPGVGSVSVSISDHGPGIPDKMKSTLLQRFEMTSDIKLTGIGLALVKELVDRCNVTIEIKDRVEGDYAQGARFVMVFPTEKEPKCAQSRL